MKDKAKSELFESQLRDLRKKYLLQVPKDIEALISLAQSLGGCKKDAQVLQQIIEQLHKLTGSGATFGLPALSEQARHIESIVKEKLAQPSFQLSRESRQQLVELLTELNYRVGARVPEKQPLFEPITASSEPNESLYVWLIEDDKFQAAKVKSQLQSFGLNIKHFLTLDAAEQLSAEQKPDLLLVDVMLDDGTEDATKQLFHLESLKSTGAPLLFMSATDNFESRVRASRLGAQGYFLKPLNVPSLVNRIDTLLKKAYLPKPRILLVDDDQQLVEHYRLVMTQSGMKVKALENGNEIIETLARWQPDLVVMDVHMPRYSGVDLAGVIRQHDRWLSLPIVFLSGERQFNEQIGALAKGADDFLTKPVSDHQLVAAVKVRVARAQELTNRIEQDGLTGLLKHSAIKQKLFNEHNRSRRKNAPLTIAMLDLDHFKSVNDSYGHAMGDLVISSVGMLLKQRLRQFDLAGRYGGEEFLVVIPECERDDGFQLFQTICTHFSNIYFHDKSDTFNCTLSVGVACNSDFSECSAEELLAMADKALYQAKQMGRNRVEVARPVAKHRKEGTK